MLPEPVSALEYVCKNGLKDNTMCELRDARYCIDKEIALRVAGPEHPLAVKPILAPTVARVET